MDSASPIAQRIAGQTSFATGITFKFAIGTNKAENAARNWLSLRSRGYRGDYHRLSHGEGQPA
ncbi:hypothetical protein HWV23_16230 [Natronomonas halophila]|jgi:hypothetical protein|uniref:hypothetical protein n=1 Tax=Natronomonas halophila TaxID=2747817 RepID=UPI0015B5F722|nr:hypothetical protein [Natronomonas halophila]QLD87204.1 hypothetical protein HWV23_16230 [Natronomonas halophila]